VYQGFGHIEIWEFCAAAPRIGLIQVKRFAAPIT
jgi:hypothetical protein